MKQIAKVDTVFPIETRPTSGGGQFQFRIVWALDESNAQYPRPLAYQFSGNAITVPDRLQPGMVCEFDWDVDGRKYTKDGKENVINNLRCWNVTVLQAAPAYAPYNPQQPVAPQYPQQQPQYAPQGQPQYQQPAPAYGQQQYAQPQGNPYGQQPPAPQQQYAQPGQPYNPAAPMPPAPQGQPAQPQYMPPAPPQGNPYGQQQPPAYGQQAPPIPPAPAYGQPPVGNPYGNAGQQPVAAPPVPGNPLYQPPVNDKLPF